MNKTTRISAGILSFTVILALFVIVLGAYTRLTDAGLGCPDWPGCYNQLVAPHNTAEIQQATALYPSSPVHVIKAWTEMVHRYIAGSLGLLIFAIGILAIRKRKAPGQPVVVPVIMMGLVIFQALLGKWTVTMKLLPVVVMGHLLGGLTILALLWWLNLKVGDRFKSVTRVNTAAFKPWAVIGLIIVAIQIALGGWTSANYAALVCPNFPYCSVQGFFPQVDFRDAFNIFNLAHANLNHASLVTIQMTHRIGAFVTAFYVGLLAICLMTLKNRAALRGLGVFMFLILAAQITLGVLNIELVLPLSIALLHNAFAALLLMAMVTLIYMSFSRDKISHG